MDASFAAAWLLPDEHSDDVETIIANIRQPCLVPPLFWHETRNIAVMAERRKRIEPGEAVEAMRRLRRLPLVSSDNGSDDNVIALAMTYGLSAYDAAYLALSLERNVPLATLDLKLSGAVLKTGIQLLGPLQKQD
jgi:predicted nucleic acid-binding protein